MTFFVLDANPVKSANMLYFLDAESAAIDGARIIVSAIRERGHDVSNLPFKPLDGHPLVKWAVVSNDNARWLYRYTRAATIKVGESGTVSDKRLTKMHERLNEIAGIIDVKLPKGQQNLFGNLYVDEKLETITSQETIESNLVWYELMRAHLSWAENNPMLYGVGGEEE